MALKALEKMRLQKQVNALKEEIQSGTLKAMEKLAKLKQRREIMVQLKGDAAPVVEPEPTPEPTPPAGESVDINESIIGFSFNGVKHAPFTKDIIKSFKGSQQRDLVLSHDKAKLAVFWNPQKGADSDSLEIIRGEGGLDVPQPQRYKNRALKSVEALIKTKKTKDGVLLAFPWERAAKNVYAEKDGQVSFGDTVTIAVTTLQAASGGAPAITALMEDGDYHSASMALSLMLFKAEGDQGRLPFFSDDAEQWISEIPADSIYLNTFADAYQKAKDRESRRLMVTSTDQEAKDDLSGSVVGFEGLNANHYAFVSGVRGGEYADIVLSNEKLGIAILWNTTARKGIEDRDFLIYWKDWKGGLLSYSDIRDKIPVYLQTQVFAALKMAERQVLDLKIDEEIGDYSVYLKKGEYGTEVTVKKGKAKATAGTVTKAVVELKKSTGEATQDPAPEPTPPAEQTGGNVLFDQYQQGKFNDLPADKFREKIVEVADAGLDFEVVKSGVVSWIDANPSLIVDAA